MGCIISKNFHGISFWFKRGIFLYITFHIKMELPSGTCMPLKTCMIIWTRLGFWWPIRSRIITTSSVRNWISWVVPVFVSRDADPCHRDMSHCIQPLPGFWSWLVVFNWHNEQLPVGPCHDQRPLSLAGPPIYLLQWICLVFSRNTLCAFMVHCWGGSWYDQWDGVKYFRDLKDTLYFTIELLYV